jgi:hypothetical protein
LLYNKIGNIGAKKREKKFFVDVIFKKKKSFDICAAVQQSYSSDYGE